jgi:hypothetical protein
MVLTEIHSLKSGDNFRWTEAGDTFQVDEEPHMIDYEGLMLVLYRNQTHHLFSHICDHTPVWLL